MNKTDFLLEQLLAANAAHEAAGNAKLDKLSSGASLENTAWQHAEPSAVLCQIIGEARANGMSLSATAAMLNAQGFRGRYGGRWYACSVRKILSRRFS